MVAVFLITNITAHCTNPIVLQDVQVCMLQFNAHYLTLCAPLPPQRQQSPKNSRCFTLREEEVTSILLIYGRNPSHFTKPKCTFPNSPKKTAAVRPVPFRMCLSNICTPSTFKLHCNAVCPHTGLSLVGFVPKLLCAFRFSLRRNT